MIDCACGFGKAIPEQQETCSVCGSDVTALHRLKALPRRYFAQGAVAAEEGRLSEAVELFSAAVSLDPLYRDAHRAIGEVYLQEQMPSEAKRHLSAALKMDPEDAGLQKAMQEANVAAERQANPRVPDQRKEPSFKKLVVIIPIATFLVGLAVVPTIGLMKRGQSQNGPPDYAKTAVLLQRSLSIEPALNGTQLSVTAEKSGLRISGDVPTELHKRLVDALTQGVVTGRVPVVLAIGVSPAQQPQTVLYTIRPGDNLSSVAAAKYGDSRLWIKIYSANRDKLSTPNDLVVGQVLVIPR